jgi:(2Fe-2S) ferredoxin
MISASNLHPPLEYHSAAEANKPQPTTVLVLPSFTVVENVTPRDTPELISQFINAGPTTSTLLDPPPPTPTSPSSPSTPTPATAAEPGTESEPLDESFTTLSLAPSCALKSYPYPHSHLILICSHRRRDARCGISAPILLKEFEKHLRPLGLWRDLTDNREGGAKVVFINHVGGHKFSANVIIYRKEDGQGIWLARVAPKHVEGIVKYTVLRGKIVHDDMIRGGFNRRNGATSW